MNSIQPTFCYSRSHIILHHTESPGQFTNNECELKLNIVLKKLWTVRRWTVRKLRTIHVMPLSSCRINYNEIIMIMNLFI